MHACAFVNTGCTTSLHQKKSNMKKMLKSVSEYFYYVIIIIIMITNAKYHQTLHSLTHMHMIMMLN